MKSNEPKPQPLRELEWLAHYFNNHGREDIAQGIFDDVTTLRHRGQGSLNNTHVSNVIDFSSSKNTDSHRRG